MRILALEDVSDDFEALMEGPFSDAWRYGRFEATYGRIEWDPVQTASRARAKLQEPGSNYGLFIADILFPDQSQRRGKSITEGLGVIRFAHERYPHLPIVAMSRGGSAPDQSHDALRQRVEDLHGPIYINKRDLQEGRIGDDELAAHLRALLQPRIPLQIMPQNDIYLHAKIEAIGEGVIADLAHRLGPGAERFEISSLQQGFSGASVFKLFEFRPGGRTPHRFVMKVSRDAENLRTELDRVPPAGRGHGRWLRYRCKAPVEIRGWHAIDVELDHDSCTLRSWLANGNADHASQVPAVLDQVFEALQEDYTDGGLEPSASAVERLWSSYGRRARAHAAVYELWPLVRDHVDSSLDLALLDWFCRDQHSRGLSARTGIFTCICHGDLHTNNILISPYNNPHLIDPARRDRWHWATDVARLAVDILVNVWDSGPKAYEWSSVAGWRGAVIDWLRGATPVGAGDNPLAWSALEWLRDSYQRYFTGMTTSTLPDWELRLAYATDFLALAGYHEIPPPKRAFALVAAHDLLQGIGSELGEDIGSPPSV